MYGWMDKLCESIVTDHEQQHKLTREQLLGKWRMAAIKEGSGVYQEDRHLGQHMWLEADKQEVGEWLYNL